VVDFILWVASILFGVLLREAGGNAKIWMVWGLVVISFGVDPALRSGQGWSQSWRPECK
jgi:hypothetical protein